MSHSRLLRRLAAVLESPDAAPRQVEEDLARLAEEHGDEAYAEFIYLLSHLRFPPPEARRHWRLIGDRRREIAAALRAPVDIRVALISYFVEVARKLDNPTVIEMRLLEEKEALAYRDELTGLRNFRFFNEFLRRELARCDRYGEPTSLIVVDVDDFKAYNDTHGHEAGNQALAAIARVLSDSVREVDLVARYGGEEFVLVVPSTPKVGARKLAEKARRRVGEVFARREGLPSAAALTVSLGVAAYPADGDDAAELIRNADRALYLAKSQGKNQVQLYARSQRSFRRVTLELDGWFSARSGPRQELRTLDLSTSGLRFASPREVPLGALVDLSLTVPGETTSLRLVGRAVQSLARGDHWEVAVCFLGVGGQERRLLTRLVRRRDES